MDRYKVEKKYHKDGDIFGEVISTSFYETKEKALHNILDEAYKMFYELDNAFEIVINPELDITSIIAQFYGLETQIYSWCCEDTEEADKN